MPIEPKREKRICPFCGNDAVTFNQIRTTVFSHTYRWQLAWYYPDCGANAPEKTRKEDQKNAD